MKVCGTFLQGWVKVGVGDITREPVDVIVNAANTLLLGGGGVDGAIHAAGGSAILEDCKQLRASKFPDGLPTGDAIATSAGKLPAKWVIHTVGPIYGRNPGREAELLRACYWNSLVLARDLGASTIVFPAISTGVYGYPQELAAEVVARTLATIQPSLPSIKEVNLIFRTEADAEKFLKFAQFPELAKT